MSARWYTALLPAFVACLGGCGSEAAHNASIDGGAAVNDAGTDNGFDSSPPVDKLVALLPIDGTTLHSEPPVVQVVGIYGPAPAEFLARIHLLTPDRAEVAASFSQMTEGAYTNIVVSAKSGELTGAYVLRVDSLPPDWSFHGSQPARSDGSAETTFTTYSAPHANRIALCGRKVIVEYSEKVVPAAAGDIAIEYADEPRTAGCTFNDAGSIPVAGFGFSCSQMDSTRSVLLTAKSLMGTVGVAAPAVTSRVVFGPPVGDCALGYVRE